MPFPRRITRTPAAKPRNYGKACNVCLQYFLYAGDLVENYMLAGSRGFSGIQDGRQDGSRNQINLGNIRSKYNKLMMMASIIAFLTAMNTTL